MATNYSVGSEKHYRTTNLPTITGYTIMGWVRPSTTTGYGAFFKLGQSNSDQAYWLARDGASFATWNSTTPLTGSSVSSGTWFHAAITVAGTGSNQLLAYYDGVLDITGDGSTNPTNAQFLTSDWTVATTEPFLGSMCNVLLYDAVLTVEEIQQQMYQFFPIRTANLNGWYPFINASTFIVDFSGNARTLTENGTPSLTDNPPIIWSGVAPTMRIPAAAAAPSSIFSMCLLGVGL